MMHVLSFRNVSCRFDDQRVVDAVSFDVAPGEIVCLLGPSGCGKTTSLRLAGGMETPDSGKILLSGETVSTPTKVVPPENRNIGFLFQDYALFPHLTVLENICFGIRHLPEKERFALARDLLAQVAMTDFEDSFPHTLSGGEQQRAALARALAPEPALLLMDEPFSSLDQQLRDQMRDLTIKMLRRTGAAGLIVTHDAADALRMADRVAVQRAGRLVQIGTPKNIYAAPAISMSRACSVRSTRYRPVNSAAIAGGRRRAGMCVVGRRCDWGTPGRYCKRGAPAPAYAVDARLVGQRHVGVGWLCDYELRSGTVAGIVSWGERLPEGDNFFVPADRLMVFKHSER